MNRPLIALIGPNTMFETMNHMKCVSDNNGSHLNADENCWIVYDTNGNCWFEEDIVKVEE